MRMAGSLLPSESRETMTALPWGRCTFQIVSLPEIETYILNLTYDKAIINLASHPNSYSLHELAKRMVSGDTKRVLDQANYILACGGMAQANAAFNYFMNEFEHD